MAKAIRKEPLAPKVIKTLKEATEMLKQSHRRTDELFKIIKGMEETIKGQQELIVELQKCLEASNKVLQPYAEKIKKAGEAAERKSNS